MMDAGRKLLQLADAKIAAGWSRDNARQWALEAHPELAAAWHGGEGDDEPAVQEHRQEPGGTNPGLALLRHARALAATGMGHDRAVRVARLQYPALARAHDQGLTVETLAAQQRAHLAQAMAGGIRRLASDTDPLRPGEVLMHRLATGPSGGFFAVAG